MSRILRRPMFRGGHVSSYGTGIAHGLADGGMPDKRGLVTGPGGYAGWEDVVKGYRVGADLLPQKPTFSKAEMMNFIKQNPGALNSGIFSTSGLEEEEILDSEGNVINTIYKDQENQYLPTREYSPKSKDELGRWQSRFGMGADTLESEPEVRGAPTPGIKYAQTEFEKLYRDMLTSPADFDFTGTAGEAEEIKEDIVSKTKEEILKDESMMEEDIPSDYKSDTMTVKEKEWSGEIDSSPSYVPPGVKIDPGEVVIGEDPGIEEMADKWYKLMGGDKARGRDLSDMALLAASKLLKPGATVSSGLSEFLGAEAEKGPGRAETLRKDATKLAITQDIQRDFLQKKLDSAESIAEKNIIAQQIRDLNKSYAPGITQKDITYGSSLEKGSPDHTMYLRKNKLSPTLASEAKDRATDPTNLSGAMTVPEANALGPVYYIDWQGIFNPETSKSDGTYLDIQKKKIIKFKGGELISSEDIEIQ
jgi:hypothetical protein